MKPAQYQSRRWLPAQPSSAKLDKMCFENLKTLVLKVKTLIANFLSFSETV